MRRKKRPESVEGSTKRGIYILPSLFTTLSLFCGFYAIIAVIDGNFESAAIAIIISFFLDGIDGKIARVTQSTSHFGAEYDSLADLVAFGIAPGVLIFSWGLVPFGRVGWLAAFLYASCGALRLARFNIQKGRLDHRYFVGLPIPSAAIFIATFILLVASLGEIEASRYLSILVMVFVLSFLMVSNIPYKSFKELDLYKKRPFQFLVAMILLMVVIVAHPKIMLFSLSFVYVVSGPTEGILQLLRKKRRKKALEEERAI
jgi:CDP-diacylglycerol--serine O-phosphatidyltransferase